MAQSDGAAGCRYAPGKRSTISLSVIRLAILSGIDDAGITGKLSLKRIVGGLFTGRKAAEQCFFEFFYARTYAAICLISALHACAGWISDFTACFLITPCKASTGDSFSAFPGCYLQSRAQGAGTTCGLFDISPNRVDLQTDSTATLRVNV